MIIEEDNFISEDDCKNLIAFYNQYYSHYGYPFGATQLIQLWDLKDKFDFISVLSNKFLKHIHNIDNNVSIDYFEIVERFPTTCMDKHYDFEDQKYTSVIYLNDNYDGGETVIEEVVIKPKIGKIVTFEGPKMLHGVNLITKGSRFTLPVWYI
jgi:hypothetical protein